jgi:hypothetical protein
MTLLLDTNIAEKTVSDESTAESKGKESAMSNQ